MKQLTLKEAIIKDLEDRVSLSKDPDKPSLLIMGGSNEGWYSENELLEDVKTEDKLGTIERVRKFIIEQKQRGKEMIEPFNNLSDV